MAAQSSPISYHIYLNIMTQEAKGDNSTKSNVDDIRYRHSQRAQQVSVKIKFA